MFHRGHVSLGNGIEDVADEEVTLRIAIRQKRGAIDCGFIGHRNAFRTFTHSKAGGTRNPCLFVLSPTQGSFVLLPTLLRTFTHGLSYFHTRIFRNSDNVSIACVTFSKLNTESNTYLTPRPVDNFDTCPQCRGLESNFPPYALVLKYRFCLALSGLRLPTKSNRSSAFMPVICSAVISF